MASRSLGRFKVVRQKDGFGQTDGKAGPRKGMANKTPTLPNPEHLPLMLQGCTLTFYIDSSQPEDSLDYHFSEVYYDGAPDSDVPNVPGHWHRLHDEHMTVLEGRVEFFVDGKSYVRGPSDPVLIIPKTHVHGFRCFKGEAARIQERTNPVSEGIKKDDFFENMLQDGTLSMSGAFRAAYAGDAVLVLTGIKALDEVARVVLGSVFTWWYPLKKEGKLPDDVLA